MKKTKEKINKNIVSIVSKGLKYENVYYKYDDMHSFSTDIERFEVPSNIKIFSLITIIMMAVNIINVSILNILFLLVISFITGIEIAFFSKCCKEYLIKIIFKNSSELNIIVYSIREFKDIQKSLVKKIKKESK